jgi:RimJ/RimL family protein N-acetyltransferase
VKLTTPRLFLRDWTDYDLEPFYQLNADPKVMEFFPKPLTRQESDQVAAKIRSKISERGWGLWAMEIPGVTSFAGFVGLSVPTFVSHFTPCVEIGWRLATAYWGNGYATEGAREALEFGFQRLSLPEIVAFAVPANLRSRSVMDKLGMSHDPRENFEHPSLSEGNPLRTHVLYRLKRPV